MTYKPMVRTYRRAFPRVRPLQRFSFPRFMSDATETQNRLTKLEHVQSEKRPCTIVECFLQIDSNEEDLRNRSG
jgi:hypothetical protein